MLSRIRPFHFILLLILLLSLVYLQGVAGVPFHPDESTYLYTSSDIGRVLKHPTALTWRPGAEEELWLLDPPLVHYAMEFGRRLAGLDPLPVNWQWKQTWAENEQRGALPSPRLLLAGRLAVAGLFPFSLLFLYLAARRLAGEFTAWVAVLLMGTNALLLLHTRRAMGEGILIFTLTLALWVLLKAEKRPWLSAIPVALAFCAKQSLAVLGLVGLVAVLWQPCQALSAGRRLRQALAYGLLSLGLIFLLTPVAWKSPLQTAQAAILARQNMMSFAQKAYPAYAIPTPAERAASLVDQVYFAPLMFYEDPAFAADIRPAQAAYLANPLNTLFRSPLAGGALLALGLLGLAAGVSQAAGRALFKAPALGKDLALDKNPDPIEAPDRAKQRRFILALLATLLQIAAVLAAIPLNWQRYYLPLVPFACLWAAYGAGQLKVLAARLLPRRA